MVWGAVSIILPHFTVILGFDFFAPVLYPVSLKPAMLTWDGDLKKSTGFPVGDSNRTGNNSLGNEDNLDPPGVSAWGRLWIVCPMANGGALTITLAPEPSQLLLHGLGVLCLKRPRSQHQPLI